MKLIWVLLCLVAVATGSAWAAECGEQAGGALCSDGRCCSLWGWCGVDEEYCGRGCQSQCDGGGGGGEDEDEGPADILTEDIYNDMLPHVNDSRCASHGFYTRNSFLEALKSFPSFGTEGTAEERRREIAAFFAQTAYETAGTWNVDPDEHDQYLWGYCISEDPKGSESGDDYCAHYIRQFPCAPGKKYFGRGPMQIEWNYEYGTVGNGLGINLLQRPEILSIDAEVSFETALWYWMTPNTYDTAKPSPHDVMAGKWEPSFVDRYVYRRLPGFGLVTNILRSDECGYGYNQENKDRIGYYKTFCDILGVDPGENLDCGSQQPYDGDWVNQLRRGRVNVTKDIM